MGLEQYDCQAIVLGLLTEEAVDNNDENCKATEKNRPQLLVPAVVENHADKTIDQTHLD